MAKAGDGLMGYSPQQIDFMLEHYWEIKSGRVPHVPGYSSGSRSSQEAAPVMCADLDKGIDALSKRYAGRWLSVCDKLTPARLETIAHKFSGWQQELVYFYLIPRGYETKLLHRVKIILCTRMNSGTKEAQLLDGALHALKF
jgi:hypothetical protein